MRRAGFGNSGGRVMKRMLLSSIAGLFFMHLIPAPVAAQSTNLIDAAKKEGGKVVVYGSLQDNSMEPIGRAFQAKTGLELNYWRGTATKVMEIGRASCRERV